MNSSAGAPEVEMQDAAVAVPATNANELAEQLRIRVLPGEEAGSASFQIQDEDHTLGNALRYMIMKNPHVEFCGYSIPHPSESLMNIRIQIYPESEEETRPIDVLMKGLDDLSDLCDVVREKFVEARDNFGKHAA